MNDSSKRYSKSLSLSFILNSLSRGNVVVNISNFQRTVELHDTSHAQVKYIYFRSNTYLTVFADLIGLLVCSCVWQEFPVFLLLLSLHFEENFCGKEL